MRRRWQFNEAALWGLFWAWTVGGIVAILVGCGIWRPHGHPNWLHSPLTWIWRIWLAPYALALAAAILAGLIWAAVGLWRNPPVRRVTEPITEDLRAREKS